MNHQLDPENAPAYGNRRAAHRKLLLWLGFLLGGVLVFIVTWWIEWPTPIIADDVLQVRANTPFPTPGRTIQIRVSFWPKHDGLTEVEILAARAREEKTNGRLSVQLEGSNGEVVAFREIPSDSLNHNQPIRLSFPPQEDSSSQKFDLYISGSPNNNVTVWGYDLDLLEATEVSVAGAETTAMEMRMITRYQLFSRLAISKLFELLADNIKLIIIACAIMFFPGCLFWVALRTRITIADPTAWLGLALGVGASTWPVLWLWMPVVGARFRAWSIVLILVLGWLAVLVISVIPRVKKFLGSSKLWNVSDNERHLRHSLSSKLISYLRYNNGLSWHHLALFLILLMALATRMLAVRDLVFPAWVDSSRHALITAIMAENGQWLQSYEPYLSADRFPYHAGFHSIAASLFLISKPELPRMLLILSQLINALVPLTIYAGAYLATGRKKVGLLAAFLVALPFFFPGYYVTWGRMTQITAVFTLPLLLGLTFRLVAGVKQWQKGWWLLALLLSGLFLIHFRVLLLYLVFLAVISIAYRGRRITWLFLAAITSVFIALPHFNGLLQSIRPGMMKASIPGYNDLPIGYLEIGWEKAFLFMGVGAFMLALIGTLRKKRWTPNILVLTAWVAVIGILLSGERLNLPETGLINTNSAYIVLFVPLSWVLAITIEQIWAWVRHHRSNSFQFAFSVIFGAIMTIALIHGFRQQLSILNPQTILADEADREAIVWVKDNLNDHPKFAVNSWRWLGNTWAGSDGGAWLVPLTGYASSTPPVDYIYSPKLVQEVTSFNEYATGVEDWSQMSSVTWLREEGITHVYIGSRGGYFDPSQLRRNSDLEFLYSKDGAFIFAVR